MEERKACCSVAPSLSPVLEESAKDNKIEIKWGIQTDGTRKRIKFQ